jgi:hypothetical protein
VAELCEIETLLHEEARDRERRGLLTTAALIRQAAEVIAHARRVDRGLVHVTADCPSGGVPRRV